MGLSAKHMPPAKICPECGAIVGRDDEDYPNHWEWCSQYVESGEGE